MQSLLAPDWPRYFQIGLGVSKTLTACPMRARAERPDPLVDSGVVSQLQPQISNHLHLSHVYCSTIPVARLVASLFSSACVLVRSDIHSVVSGFLYSILYIIASIFLPASAYSNRRCVKVTADRQERVAQAKFPRHRCRHICIFFVPIVAHPDPSPLLSVLTFPGIRTVKPFARDASDAHSI
ncbi:hypothetical protein CONLIGDRAFT_162790 [Coniochaeta ligniaria NRRL 30616]|uniref:Uncharacterized protein n=1 Tax=Coniochaeta ligniaria NRRL 30616 TaxID=1408157 RepID=A0A1J7J0U0_9PEZI|nr:hypothetical protein CONLIGDRAFT_162790 [Coniochaeta ligniaria NRRL 30616]